MARLLVLLLLSGCTHLDEYKWAYASFLVIVASQDDSHIQGPICPVETYKPDPCNPVIQ